MRNSIYNFFSIEHITFTIAPKFNHKTIFLILRVCLFLFTKKDLKLMTHTLIYIYREKKKSLFRSENSSQQRSGMSYDFTVIFLINGSFWIARVFPVQIPNSSFFD